MTTDFHSDDSRAVALEALAAAAEAAGLTLEQLIAEATASRAVTTTAEVEVIRRRPRRVKAPPIPEEHIPTKARALEFFTLACARRGVTPNREWRRAVVRLRISVARTGHTVSESPIRQMELAMEACARFELYPEVLLVEFGQTAYVAYDEDDRRQEFWAFLDDIGTAGKRPPPGAYDGWVIVCQRLDRLARMITVGSILIDRCLAHGVDILEFGEVDDDVETVPKLPAVKWDYIRKFEKAQQEWEDIQKRQQQSHDWKINRGDLLASNCGIGHLQRWAAVPGEARLRVVELIADPDYVPLIQELLERNASGETRHAIATDWRRRVEAGTMIGPPPRIGKDGEEVVAKWLPATLTSIIQAPRLIGCQRNSAGELVPTPHIEPLVSEELYHAANAAVEAQKRKYPSTSTGPKPRKIGSGLLSCLGCGDTGRGASHGGYACRRRFPAEHHFSLRGYIDTLLRDVTVGLLDSLPEMAQKGKSIAAGRTANESTRQRLLSEQANSLAERTRLLDMRQADRMSDAELDRRLAPVDARLTEISLELAATIAYSTSVLESLREGETWGSRWDAEYARPNHSGLPWIRALLAEVWERIDVAVGPQYKGGEDFFHEGRLTFVGRDGFEVDPAFVEAVASKHYLERRTNTDRFYGWAPLTEKAKDMLFELHYEKQMSFRAIARKMNDLMKSDPDLGSREPLTEHTKAQANGRTWTAKKVTVAMPRIYAERGLEYEPVNVLRISRADREMLIGLVDRHGEEEAAALMNTFGSKLTSGAQWTADRVRRAVEAKPDLRRTNSGRRTTTKEMVDIAESLHAQGKTLDEIRRFFLNQPSPAEVSITTLSRRLAERRRERAIEAAARLNEAA